MQNCDSSLFALRHRGDVCSWASVRTHSLTPSACSGRAWHTGSPRGLRAGCCLGASRLSGQAGEKGHAWSLWRPQLLRAGLEPHPSSSCSGGETLIFFQSANVHMLGRSPVKVIRTPKTHLCRNTSSHRWQLLLRACPRCQVLPMGFCG